MRLTSRLKTALWVVAGYVLLRVVELNTDGLLEKSGLDSIVPDAFPDQVGVPMMSLWTDYVIPALAFFIGPFGLGFVIAAVLFSLPDVPVVRRRLAQRHDGKASPREWRPEGLHVSWMTLNAKRLDTDLVMEIDVHGFNATGYSISLADMRGNIRFRESIETPPEMGTDLPSPVLLRDRTRTQGIADLSDIFFVIQQHVPRDVAERISARMKGGKRVRLDFNQINITVSQTEQPLEIARLPLWGSATMHRSADHVWLMKVHEIQAIDILAFGISDNVRNGGL